MYIRNPETNVWEEVFLPPTGDTLPIGAITEFGGENAPTNWLFCNGQAVSRETYPELFSVIGTTYGDGDGSTTFNVPDFSSRSPMGVGTGTDGTNSETTTLGQEKGEYKHTLTENEMPSHNHLFKFTKQVSNPSSGTDEIYFGIGRNYNTNDNSNKTENKGKDQPHNTVHPVLGVNFIIKAKQSVGIVGTVVSDMNAQGDNDVAPTKVIKDYVDEKQTYSTDEIVVGTWLGKPLYRKVIDFGALPNASSKDVNSGLTNVIMHHIYGVARKADNTTLVLSYATIDPLGNISLVFTNDNKVRIQTGSDRTAYSAYIILEYTKTTD